MKKFKTLYLLTLVFFLNLACLNFSNSSCSIRIFNYNIGDLKRSETLKLCYFMYFDKQMAIKITQTRDILLFFYNKLNRKQELQHP